VPLVLIWLLRHSDGGFYRVSWLFVTIALADVVAMFGGMYFGRRRIFPILSPGKTLEGTAAGLIGALAAAAMLRDGFTGVAPAVYYGCTALLFAAGMAGDLAASGLKRQAGIKDFGTALPGHGGVMDRLDSLLLAAPVAYFLADLLSSG
jgi:phosphatidate cytidylyltransferase